MHISSAISLAFAALLSTVLTAPNFYRRGPYKTIIWGSPEPTDSSYGHEIQTEHHPAPAPPSHYDDWKDTWATPIGHEDWELEHDDWELEHADWELEHDEQEVEHDEQEIEHDDQEVEHDDQEYDQQHDPEEYEESAGSPSQEDEEQNEQPAPPPDHDEHHGEEHAAILENEEEEHDDYHDPLGEDDESPADSEHEEVVYEEDEDNDHPTLPPQDDEQYHDDSSPAPVPQEDENDDAIDSTSHYNDDHDNGTPASSSAHYEDSTPLHHHPQPPHPTPFTSDHIYAVPVTIYETRTFTYSYQEDGTTKIGTTTMVEDWRIEDPAIPIVTTAWVTEWVNIAGPAPTETETTSSTPSAFDVSATPTTFRTLSVHSHGTSHTLSPIHKPAAASSSSSDSTANSSSSTSSSSSSSDRPGTSSSYPENPSRSDNGQCGFIKNMTCLGAGFGSCCSPFGWCGSSTLHCGHGCQVAFGTCDDESSSASNQTTSNSILRWAEAMSMSSSTTASTTNPVIGVETPTANTEVRTSADVSSSNITSATTDTTVHPTPSAKLTQTPSISTTNIVPSPSSESSSTTSINTPIHHNSAEPTKTSRAKSLKEMLREKYGSDAYAYLGNSNPQNEE